MRRSRLELRYTRSLDVDLVAVSPVLRADRGDDRLPVVVRVVDDATARELAVLLAEGADTKRRPARPPEHGPAPVRGPTLDELVDRAERRLRVDRPPGG